jgi:hypothetical protein
MTPVAGKTLSAARVALGVAVAAIGPGSGATPGNAGDLRTMGVVESCTTGAKTFLCTGALCLCTVDEPALVAIIAVEKSNAAEVITTKKTFARRVFKRRFITFPFD